MAFLLALLLLVLVAVCLIGYFIGRRLALFTSFAILVMIGFALIAWYRMVGFSFDTANTTGAPDQGAGLLVVYVGSYALVWIAAAAFTIATLIGMLVRGIKTR